MQLQITTKEQVESLKELGYPIPQYADKDVLPYVVEAIKWLFAKKSIYVMIVPFYMLHHKKTEYFARVFNTETGEYIQETQPTDNFDTPFDAESAGLDAALKYLKDK